jgi:hypothetical protein
LYCWREAKALVVAFDGAAVLVESLLSCECVTAWAPHSIPREISALKSFIRNTGHTSTHIIAQFIFLTALHPNHLVIASIHLTTKSILVLGLASLVIIVTGRQGAITPLTKSEAFPYIAGPDVKASSVK